MSSIKPQTSRDNIERAFALSIYAKADALRTAELTRGERARLREAIVGDLRKASDLLCHVTVSEAAQAEAAKRGVELAAMSWHDQPKFDRGRKVFHFEHLQPIGSWLEAVCKQSSAEGVLALLRKGFRIAWILKVEDRRLTELGYRSDRPDPGAAYQAAGISLVGGG
ncbi:MAG TPA: hypothetical protein VFN08_15740 [Gemmatimonadales bacterium]|jgi:hypothetical protein|nr:hypothetical protein [Gemmatimonadales bacterium]